MKFESKDLDFEVPTLVDFVVNAPSEKIAFKSSFVKAIWGPSQKGYMTIVCESFKLFVHKNSACGEWFLENLPRFEEFSIALAVKATSFTGRDFEVEEIVGTSVTWELAGGKGPGLIATKPSPSKKKSSRKTSTAGALSEPREGASSLSNDR